MNDPFEQRSSNIPRREVPRPGARKFWLWLETGDSNPRASISIFWEALRGLSAASLCAGHADYALLVIAALNLPGPRGEDLSALFFFQSEVLEASAERYASYFRLQQRFLASSADSKATV